MSKATKELKIKFLQKKEACPENQPKEEEEKKITTRQED